MESEIKKTHENPYSFEYEIADQIRRQHRLINELKGLKQPDNYQTIVLEKLEQSLAESAELVIRMKSNATDGVPDTLPNFSAEHDGIDLFITAPNFKPEEKPLRIPVQISTLSPDHLEYLPPISEQLVVNGIRDTEKEIRISYYAIRHENDESLWQRYQAATININNRLIAAIKAKSSGHLPNVNIYKDENEEKVTIDIPTTNLSDEYRTTFTKKVSILEEFEPSIREYLTQIS